MNKQQLQNTVTELQAALDKAKDDLAKAEAAKAEVWVPNVNSHYYFVTASFSHPYAAKCSNTSDEIDHARIDYGNCFKTEEQASRAAKRFRLMLWLEQQAIAHNEPDKPAVYQIRYYSLNYGFGHEIRGDFGTPSFTRGVVQHVIDNMPNEIKQLWRELV